LRPKFFGQFLIDEGVIEAGQLRQANDHLYFLNRVLGELAIKKNYMSREDVERVKRAQLACDALFGELAQELGLLTPAQLAELLTSQSARQARVGEALVELGHLEEIQLKELLERFEASQAPFLTANRSLPEALEGSRSALLALDLVPTLALRTAILTVKLGRPARWTKVRFPHRLTVEIPAPGGLELGIGCDDAFARTLAWGRCKPSSDEMKPNAVARELRDFLLTVGRNIVSALGRDEKLQAPREDKLPSGGWAIDFVAIEGRGKLVLEPLD